MTGSLTTDEKTASGRRVLGALDDIREAYALKADLAAKGATAFGPVMVVEDFLDFILCESSLDAAIIAVSL